MDTLSSLRLRPSISDQTFCQIFMKLDSGVPYKVLSRVHEFCENRLTVGHTLLKGVNKFVSALLIIYRRISC
jgi:hypothetical protein